MGLLYAGYLHFNYKSSHRCHGNRKWKKRFYNRYTNNDQNVDWKFSADFTIMINFFEVVLCAFNYSGYRAGSFLLFLFHSFSENLIIFKDYCVIRMKLGKWKIFNIHIIICIYLFVHLDFWKIQENCFFSSVYKV